MTVTTAKIEQVVQAIVQFQRDCNQESSSSQSVKTSLTLADSFLKAWVTDAHLSFAQCEAIYAKYTAHRWLISLNLVLLFAKGHRISDTFLQHVLAGQILASGLRKVSKDEQRQRLTKRCIQATNTDHFEVFQWALRKSLQPTDTPVIVDFGRVDWCIYNIIVSAMRIAEALAAKANMQPSSLFSAIKKEVRQNNDMAQIVEPILCPSSPVYSGLLVKQRSRSYALLHATGEQITIAAPVATDGNKTKLQIRSIKPAEFYSHVQLQKRVPVNRLRHFYETPKTAKFAGSAYVKAYSIQRPPADLLDVLKALRLPDVEPIKIAKLIDNNALFTQLLNHSATQLNRLNINVSNIKQSIMTHGMERIAAVLTEHVLWQRLSAAQFPLHLQFKSFVNCYRMLAAGIAESCKLGIPQQFSLIALIHASAFFTHAPLRLINHWRYDDSDINSVDSLLPNELNINLTEHAYTLAKAWNLESEITNTFSSTTGKNKAKQPYHDCLTIASYLTRMWLHQGEVDNSALFSHHQSACSRLSLTESKLHELLEKQSEYLQSPVNFN
ncbi:HDOD domain-containing protein [Alteromonas facilis]|uniref:HDOD domain-containing protein n=1 Tax=Alteromonas facilis TaxID=2048004 RepID=UPI000C28B904|nr:HDOD domain-containing protein [Alteromonas facilis]